MKILSNNQILQEEFNRLINSYLQFSFAVSGASSWCEIFDLFNQQSDRITKAIIGTNLYQTPPKFLDTFNSNQNIKFVLKPNAIFHSDVYLFGNKDNWEALIGSKNHNYGAHTNNSEVMILISNTDEESTVAYDQIISLINRYWDNSQNMNPQLFENYREVWQIKQIRTQRHIKLLSDQYGNTTTNRLSVDSFVMSMNWDSFFQSVQNDNANHGCAQRCDFLNMVSQKFKEEPIFYKMPLNVRKTIAGLTNDLEPERATWFGNMQGDGIFHSALNNNNAYFSSALDHIPISGMVEKYHYKEFIRDFKCAFSDDKMRLSAATRLLTLKRPDQFVCLTGGNRPILCNDFGIPQLGLDYDRYWDEIIERIFDTQWWNSNPPNAESLELAVWKVRVAMLDAVIYQAIV